MRIYNELIFIILFFLLILIWWIWLKISRKKALRKYKPENDRAKKIEKEKSFIRGSEVGGLTEGEHRTERDGKDNKRQRRSKRQKLLPTATPDVAGKDSSSNRKRSRGFKGLLERRRKK